MAGHFSFFLKNLYLSPSGSSDSTAAPISQWDNLLISDRRISDVIESVVFGDREFTWIDFMAVIHNQKAESLVKMALPRADAVVDNIKEEKVSMQKVNKKVMEVKKNGTNVNWVERQMSQFAERTHQRCVNQFKNLKIFDNLVDEKSDIAMKFDKIRIKLMNAIVEEQNPKIGRQKTEPEKHVTR